MNEWKISEMVSNLGPGRSGIAASNFRCCLHSWRNGFEHDSRGQNEPQARPKKVKTCVKWAILGLFFVYFCLFKQTWQFLQQIYMNFLWPSSIWRQHSNPQPLNESPLVTTRPGLPRFDVCLKFGLVETFLVSPNVQFIQCHWCDTPKVQLSKNVCKTCFIFL